MYCLYSIYTDISVTECIPSIYKTCIQNFNKRPCSLKDSDMNNLIE